MASREIIYKRGYTCATKIFLFGARHYEKPSTGYSDLENILLAGAYAAFSVIHVSPAGPQLNWAWGASLDPHYGPEAWMLRAVKAGTK